MRLARLSSLATARTAIVLGTLVFACNVAALGLMAEASYATAELVRLAGLLPTVAVGTLVAARRPRNPMGWLMLGCGFFFSTQAIGTAYAIVDYRLHHGTLPLGRLALVLQPGWAMGMVFVAGLLWLFPDGQLPSGRWRRVGGLLFGSGVVFGLLMYGQFISVAVRRVVPVGADGTPALIDHPDSSMLIWVVIENVGFIALLLSWLVWLVLQIPKYRRSTGDRRLQLKWLYSGAAIFIVCLGTGVISRTVSYALVTGLVVGVYVGVVTLTNDVLDFSSSVGVAASTLVAAVLFNPVRRRAQRLVDKRFNRARYDAEATVAAFADAMRSSADLPSVQGELVTTVNQAFEPVHVSVWVNVS
jgi:hypothetical protein